MANLESQTKTEENVVVRKLMNQKVKSIQTVSEFPAQTFLPI